MKNKVLMLGVIFSIVFLVGVVSALVIQVGVDSVYTENGGKTGVVEFLNDDVVKITDTTFINESDEVSTMGINVNFRDGFTDTYITVNSEGVVCITQKGQGIECH